MSAFDTLEAQLRASTRRRRRLRVPALVALAAALVVAFVLARSGEGTVDEETVATATPSASELPAEQLAAFAVLRRPQSALERSAKVDKLVATLPNVRRGDVRVLRADPMVLVVPLEQARGVRDLLCLVVVVPGHGSGSNCGTLDEVLRGRARFSLPPRGLAPDYAKRVALRVRGGKTITVRPRNNFYDLTRPGHEPYAGIAPPRWIRR